MAFFPFFVELQGQDGLIVGGGQTALGKARHLLAYGPRLTVIAPRVLPELETLDGVRTEHQSFACADLRHPFVFVIAATDDVAVNHTIAVQPLSDASFNGWRQMVPTSERWQTVALLSSAGRPLRCWRDTGFTQTSALPCLPVRRWGRRCWAVSPLPIRSGCLTPAKAPVRWSMRCPGTGAAAFHSMTHHIRWYHRENRPDICSLAAPERCVRWRETVTNWQRRRFRSASVRSVRRRFGSVFIERPLLSDEITAEAMVRKVLEHRTGVDG